MSHHENDTAARIYVACLASYNAGRLHGAWIAASTDVDEMAEAVDKVMRTSPCPNILRATYENRGGDQITRQIASPDETSFRVDGVTFQMVGKPFRSAEEWAIHDHEGLGDVGEWARLEDIARRVHIAEAAETADIPVSALQAAMSDLADDDVEPDEFISDRYRGAFDSWADFAQQTTEETGDMQSVPEWLVNHIDWESLGRDHKQSGDFSEFDGHWFWAH